MVWMLKDAAHQVVGVCTAMGTDTLFVLSAFLFSDRRQQLRRADELRRQSQTSLDELKGEFEALTKVQDNNTNMLKWVIRSVVCI
eukprot:4743353-Pyramimonas_sp.AAC.1